MVIWLLFTLAHLYHILKKQVSDISNFTSARIGTLFNSATCAHVERESSDLLSKMHECHGYCGIFHVSPFSHRYFIK